MESVRLLTAGLIDYAGLFPPAQLPMTNAVRNYAEYLDAAEAEMLGRFILPASRLDEFGECASQYLPRAAGAQPWKLAVLLGEKFQEEIPAILKFNCSHWVDSPSGHAVIDVVEMKASKADTVMKLKAALPDFYRAFIEIPLSERSEALLSAIRDAQYSAKIRTGGIEEAAFPTAAAIVDFMTACKRQGLSFKATAGLHHIVCSTYPLTYEPDSASAKMFGFLNIFVAAAFLFHGSSEDDVRAIVEESDASAFGFDDQGLNWRGKAMSLAQIEKVRKEFAISFGSCSFTEPAEELAKLLAQTWTPSE